MASGNRLEKSAFFQLLLDYNHGNIYYTGFLQNMMGVPHGTQVKTFTAEYLARNLHKVLFRTVSIVFQFLNDSVVRSGNHYSLLWSRDITFCVPSVMANRGLTTQFLSENVERAGKTV